MLKYSISIYLLLLCAIRPAVAQDTLNVELPHYYPKAELVQKKAEYPEKFDSDVTITSFEPVGERSMEDENALQSGTDEQHNAWLAFVLEDIKSNSFRDDSNGWIPDEVFTGCHPYRLDSAGWMSSETTGQQFAILRAVCLHKKKNYGSDWYLNIVSLIELNGAATPTSVLSSHGGLDNDWENDETSVVKIEFVANIDDDIDLEIVLLRQLYAGASYLVLDRNSDGTYSQTRIHHASWD